jgi:DNA-binding NarL/FixJ family response regulator
MQPISVLLVDDHLIVREGFRSLLKLDASIAIIGEARDGREAVVLAAQLHPDVVVMDIAMPLLNGLGATQQILAARPETRIIILSAHSDDAYIERALEVGAAGYLIKQTSALILAQAIREVHAGRPFFSPSISRRIHEQYGTSSRSKGLRTATKLTAREMEVIQLVAEGAPNKKVAADLGISIKTVEKHRQHLMDKLNIHDTAGLTRYAIAHGIIESSVQVTIA